MLSIDAQIAELADIAEPAGRDWWLNSGQLLSLVRDGHPLPGYRDVDVDCWAQPNGWNDLESGLASVGYQIDRRVFRGMLYKYWLRHPDGRRPVDMHIWRKDGDDAWCPAISVRPSPYRRRTARWLAFGVARRPVRVVARRGTLAHQRIARRVYERFGCHVNVWRCPARFFEDTATTSLSGVLAPIPTPTEEYLEFRYGDWATPDPEWVYQRDDATYVWAAPPKVSPTPPFGQQLLQREGSRLFGWSAFARTERRGGCDTGV